METKKKILEWIRGEIKDSNELKRNGTYFPFEKGYDCALKRAKEFINKEIK